MGSEKRVDLSMLIYLVNKLKNKHLKVTALSEAGIHGIRYYNNKLQGYNSTDEEWFDISDGQIAELIGFDELSTDAETITGAINELEERFGNISYNDLKDKPDLSNIGSGSNTPTGNIAITWDDVSDKPSTFQPSVHNHDDRYYTESEIDTKIGNLVLSTTSDNITGAINELKTSMGNISYNDLSDKPNLTAIYRYCGSVDNYSDLPSQNLEIGMAYNVVNADATHNIKAGDNVVWDGSAWDNHGGDIDLSAYVTSSGLESVVGTAALTTTASTLKEAINELKSAISNISSDGGGGDGFAINPTDTTGLNVWIETD